MFGGDAWRGWAVAVVLASALLAAADCYRVLVVFPFPGKSHGILGNGYVRELLKHGHEVTYITPFPTKDPPTNLTQVDVSSLADKIQVYFDTMNLTRSLDGTPLVDDSNFQLMPHSMLKSMLEHKRVRELIADKTQRFDVVISEWFFSELLAGFAALYRCPLVWSSSLDVHGVLLRLVDDVSSPAYSTDINNALSQPFSFLQRAGELWTLLQRLYVIEFTINPLAAEVYRDAFGAAAAARGVVLPPYEELIYNASLILANGHASLGEAPRLPQSVKEIGGYHLQPTPEPLPEKLQKLMDEASHGVILFSLGSNVKSKDMPAVLKAGLLRTFGELKQTVLWKLEEEIPNLPPNVHIEKWLPQQSILAHRNTKLFVTHGGLLSTTETLHYGVPIVGVPLFADQFIECAYTLTAHRNTKLFVTHGGLLSTTETLHYGVPIVGVPLFADQFIECAYTLTAHRNTKLFVTHGGLLSTTETLHYGVPIVGVPLFADQFIECAYTLTAHRNTKLFVTHGGLLSTTETLHYGVPIVGVPLFADQFIECAYTLTAHRNTKLFVTHGGLLSTTETLHYGVPIVGVPLFADQFIECAYTLTAHRNTKLFVTHGGLLSTTETLHYGVPIVGVPLFADQFIECAYTLTAHRNTKLFVTHGGLLSTTETLHYGVPIVGVPLFADQFINMQRAANKGFAVPVRFTWDLPRDLALAINEVLTNASYTESARHLSALYHDRPLPPAAELVYWVEHVVRTRGAPHLRSAALLLAWYQRLYLDLLAAAVGVLLFTALLVRALFKRLVGGGKRRNVKQKRQ